MDHSLDLDCVGAGADWALLCLRDTRRAMSSDQIVRKPLRARECSRRTLDQRVFLRFPRLGAASFRLIGKLPPGSRLRQAAVWRTARLGLEAYNRRDLDAVLIGFHPECEYRPGRDWVEGGLVEPCYRGPQGYREYVATVDEVWGGENYLMPVELIDLGERIVMLADGSMRAQASGVSLAQVFALVSTMKDGRVIRHQEYYDHAEALEAVGLRE
jgi:ketosteroid isomerase-like protein